MPGKILRRIYHACWYIFAAMVLVSAIFITLIRTMLPHVGNYREELESTISRQTGYTVSIENARGEWEGWVPIIRFDGIKISTSATDLNISRLKSATIRFDPYASFRQRQFTPFHLTITGPDLTMVLGADGSLGIATDTTNTTVLETGTNNVPFVNWLFLQKTITINDARIRFMDARKKFEPVLLSNVDLVLKNSAAHMQINGSMVLPAAYGEKCSFALDLYGDISTPDWSGQIYIDAMRARPGAWLSHVDTDAPFILGGTPADVRIWSSWQGARLTRINGTFVASGLHLAPGAMKLDVQHINALFTLVPDQDSGFRVKVKMKELRTGNGTWPVTETSVIRQPFANGEHFRYIIHSDYLDLKDVTATIKDNTGTKNSFVSEIPDTSGDLLDCLIVYDPGQPPAERIAFDTRVRRLTLGKGQDLRVRNLEGRLAGNTGHGVFTFDTPSSEIRLPGMMQKTFILDELQGGVLWHADNDSLRLETAYLQAHTPHFNAALKGNIVFTAGNNLPFVDLLFSAGDLDLENIRYYLPAVLPKTHDWIKQALVAGDVSALDVVLRGHMSEFPFDNNEGRIEAIANIHNGTLDYHASWVPVDNIEAELRIDGRTLTVDANSGNIYNAVITHAHGIIADLGADTNAVAIRGTIKGQTKDAMTFIRNSPLSESRLLSEITRHNIDGAFTLDLGLHIPLIDMPITYDGNIQFDNTTLKSPAYGIDLDHITGDVAFTETKVSTGQLTADYFKKPVNLTIDNDENNGLRLGLKGNSNGTFIAGQLAHFFQAPDKFTSQLRDLMDGNCDWQVILSLLENSAGAQNSDEGLLRISSSLAGLAINLPAPLGKTTHDTLPLEITTTISTSPHKHIEFTYGDGLAGSMDFNKANAGITISRTELALGQGATLSKEGNGLIIHGAVHDLPLSEWYGFFHAAGANIFGAAVDNFLIDITAGKLGLAGQQYENTHFKLVHESPGWRVTVNGGNIDGAVFIPTTTQSGAIRGTFSRLKITRPREDHPRAEPDPGSFPPLQFTVDDFVYGDFSLGKLELDTMPAVNGMFIDKLSFTKPELTITGKGTWTSANGHANSEFELDLRAETLATMLTTFNYNLEPVRDGASRFILKAQWPGTPMDFSLASLAGSLNMKIEKGQFMNIEPKAGRLFGLLNLQTLIRLMSLDLSVLFSKGYTFDKIEGNFTIESGNAYTNNLTVKGHSADIEVTGRTGLVDKDYDQIATITPRALFGPVGAGLGAMISIAGEVFQSLPEKIDQLLRYQYIIQGSWETPVIKKYNSEY